MSIVYLNNQLCKAILCIIIFIPSVNHATSDVLEPSGYKLNNYKSATPDTLKGVIVIDAKTAKILHEQNKVLFIDVLPTPKRPESFSDEDVWLPKKRLNIPGSIWLPDVGYGVLSDEIMQYFNLNLQKLTNHNLNKSLVFYCNINCWMSWNAAKRALSYGYTHVYWFPGGADTWAASGYDLEEAKAVPLNTD